MESGFKPAFETGLLPAVVQDADTREVLMLAYMNEEAFRLTIQTGETHFWSRSRKKIWHKGETSGHVQKIVAMRLDCDGDAILLLVQQTGAACHTGHASCFFREYKDGGVSECSPVIFDPDKVYG